MIQIQPKYAEKEAWYDLAVKEALRFEILEFSSLYLNTTIPDTMLDWYKKTGLVHSIHGVFMDNFPLSPDHKIRSLSRIRCEESCQLTSDIGSKNIVLHSTALSFLRGPVMRGWCKDAAEYYQEMAEKYDLNIFIENFNEVDPEPLLVMMEYVTDPRLKICFDAGHANYSRMSVSDWIKELNDHIGYLHLSDNHGQWDDHCALGSGSVDFESVSNWWKSHREVPVTIEVPTIKGVEDSLSFLKQHEYFGFSNGKQIKEGE